MTILVTGGTGLVGSRLLRHMVSAGIDCRALVRPGKELPVRVTAVEGDLLDPVSLAAAVEGVSAIVHLAAVLRTRDSEAIWKTNVVGTRNLIHAARQQASDLQVVMASTGLVYNSDAAYPALEGDPVDPALAYPASKVAAERELRDSGLNWTILRLGFVYGDGDEHLQAIPGLAARFKWHPATRFSLVHHRDIAAAVDLALAGAMGRRVVNIVDDAPISIYEIARLVGAAIEPCPEPLTNPWFGQLDGTLARSLGFQPAVATVHQSYREGSH